MPALFRWLPSLVPRCWYLLPPGAELLGRRGRFTTNIVIDSVIVTDREFSLGLSRLFLTNVFCDRQGGLETRSYESRGVDPLIAPTSSPFISLKL